MHVLPKRASQYLLRRRIEHLFFATYRLLSTANLSSPETGKPANPDKAYSKTLLLPKTSFPLWSDPQKREAQFRKGTCDELYRWQVRPRVAHRPGVNIADAVMSLRVWMK
jgi:hypothetical protein